VPNRYVIDENTGNIIQIAEDFGIFASGKGTGCQAPGFTPQIKSPPKVVAKFKIPDPNLTP
jgi:hypothetical protein